MREKRFTVAFRERGGQTLSLMLDHTFTVAGRTSGVPLLFESFSAARGYLLEQFPSAGDRDPFELFVLELKPVSGGRQLATVPARARRAWRVLT